MIGFLRAIFDALVRVLNTQAEVRAQITFLQADMDDQLATQSAAIEYLRELIEGDNLPAIVNPPTFSATGDNA